MRFIKLGKKTLKISGITVAVLVALLAIFYLWFIHHAEKAIEDIVSLQSNGKLKVEIGKIKYNYGKKLSLQNISFHTVDTSKEEMGYNFHIRELHLTVRSVRSLIFDKQLLIDSILVENPDITITRRKESEEKHLSLPEEMGKIYESIEKALAVLSIKRFQIDDARITLLDRTNASLQPLTISRLHFHIDNFKVDTSRHKQFDKFLFSDNVVLNTHHQSFSLPDGRHHIAFKGFSINIRQKLVVLDSCTILAFRNPGSPANFSMFVDTMKLTNVDFLALSRQGLIRADSVYLVNSDISLQLKEDSIRFMQHQRNKKPEMQRVLRGLASDMQLAYIGVKNASVNVSTEKDNQVNTFASSHNNFELYKVVVDTKAEQPVSVEQFLMAIRNYDAYGKDSAYRLQFDSIRFTNNTVRLNNFSVTTRNGANVDAQRNYHMPLFKLKGLSWQELLFHRHIVANEAVLHRPVMIYAKNPGKNSKDKRSIYELFTILDTLINLKQIRMIDGEIDYKLNSNTRLVLNNVNASVNTERLLSARSSGFIERAVDGLSFSKGTVTTPRFNINMNKAFFEGRGRSLVINQFNLKSKDGNINLNAEDLALKDLLLNDSIHLLRIDHISWKRAKLAIVTKEHKDSSAPHTPLKLHVNGIQLNNTDLSFTTPKQSIQTFIHQAAATSIIKEPDAAPELKEFLLKGSNLQFNQGGSSIEAAEYSISDERPSSLKKVKLAYAAPNDTMQLSATALQFTPYFASFERGPARIDDITIHDPAGIFRLQQKENSIQKNKPWPELAVNALHLINPDLQVTIHKDSAITACRFKSNSAGNRIDIDKLKMHSKPHDLLQASWIHFSNHALQLSTTGKDSSELSIAALSFSMKDFALQRTKKLGLAGFIDQCTIQQLHEQNNFKHKTFHIDSAQVTGFQFNSDWVSESEKFFRHSPAISLKRFTGYYTTRADHFSWENLAYSRAAQTLSLDSFRYSPVADQDAYIAAHPYQTDYIKASTGAIHISKFDPYPYFTDSTVSIHTIDIAHPRIDVFRDKRPPFQHGIYKPLPTALVKKIPFFFSIDSIRLHNMKANYAELSNKTNEVGVVRFTHLNASLFPVRNTNLNATDSLRLRASATFLDSIGVKLNMDESYTDSLQGFVLNVQMSPANLRILNPVLLPLTSIKVRRGQLDTMLMHAVGRDHLSLGTMNMYYHNLNVQFLKPSAEDQTTFVTRLLTWVANHIVLRKKNTKRTGVVYFPRFRDRSIFNYWIKMTLSGAASNVGVKRNKKYMRRYHKALRQKQLPPIQHLE